MLQKDKHFTFEDPKSSTSDATSTAAAAQEWLDALDRSRDIASSRTMANSFSGSIDDTLFNSSSTSKSPTMNFDLIGEGTGNWSHLGDRGDPGQRRLSDGIGAAGLVGGSTGAGSLIEQATNSNANGEGAGRRHLMRPGRDGDGEGGKEGPRGFKRFSRRQSKNGLAAVF